MGAWKSNVSVFREGKGSVWKRTYIPMLSYVYKNTGGENDRSGRLHGTVGTDPGNSGRKRLPGTGEEGAAVFAYAGDRYEECYREKLEEPAYGKDPARVFSVSVNLCGHPKESEVVFENQKYRWDDYGHNSIVKTGFRLNNKTEKHSTIGSGGGMKTKWREKNQQKKKRDCSSDIGGAFFLVSAADSGKPADSKRTGRSGGDVCQRRKRREQRGKRKSEEVQEQEPGSTDQNLFRTIDFTGLRSKIEKSARGSGFRAAP